MRPIPDGYEARLEVVVTDEMTVDFAELGRVHPVYATYWMARHVEEAARKIIIQFFEDDEDGVGTAVSVRHVSPAVPGTRLELIARHARTETVPGRPARVHAICRVLRSDGTLVGEGTTEQAVLPRADFYRLFEDLDREA